jgi:hypothetical protein
MVFALIKVLRLVVCSSPVSLRKTACANVRVPLLSLSLSMVLFCAVRMFEFPVRSICRRHATEANRIGIRRHAMYRPCADMDHCSQGDYDYTV